MLFSSGLLAQTNPDVYLYNGSAKEISLDSSRYEVKTRNYEKPPKVVVVRKKKEEPKTEPEKAEEPSVIEPKVDATTVVNASDDTDAIDPTTKVAPKKSWVDIDPRFNYVQLSLAPGYYYIDADSPSWYRNYHSATPAANLKAEFWMHESVSLSLSLMNSMAADVRAEPGTDRKVSVDFQEYETGLYFRKYSARHRMATSLIGGVTYNDFQMKLKSTEDNRVELKSKGVGLSFATRIPQDPNHAYTIATTFRPNVKISEGGTDADYKSGDLDKASAWEFSFKSEYLVDRKNIFYWAIQHQFEKAIYSGETTGNDPITGDTFDGLSVRTGKTMLSIGITWGN